MSDLLPTSPAPWPISRCQETLWEAACQILLIREELEILKGALPLPDDFEERLEGRLPYDIPTEILKAIEAVNPGALAPAQATLERAAGTTDERLAEELRVRKERGAW
jgi:hypothetical protein